MYKFNVCRSGGGHSYTYAVRTISTRKAKSQKGTGRNNEADGEIHHLVRTARKALLSATLTSTMSLAKLFDPVVKLAAKTYRWRVSKELNKMGK
jgi:hypothetical protein